MTESPGNLRQSASAGKIAATFIGYGLVCIPLAGVAWDAASDLISGHLSMRKAGIGAIALILLIIALRFAARSLVKIDAPSTSNPA